MPVAVVSQEEQRFDLESAPPDGFVVLRALPFGKRLERRDMISKLAVEQDDGKRKRNSQPEKAYVETFIKAARVYEFDYCIVDHNLQDANGNKLDFSNSMSLEVLDPKIGEEIEKLIDKIHGDDEEDLEDFFRRSTSHSEDEQVSLETAKSD